MNLRRYIGIFVFIMIIIIAVLTSFASEYFWYWKFWWFDILMHFLGGLWVASASLWAYYFSDYFKNPKTSDKNIFWTSLISVLIIGIGWEVFEFVIEIVFSSDYILDTVCDLGMDIVGALVVFLVFRKLLVLKNSIYGK